MMSAGMAVDVTRMYATKTQMQDALDAALLATTRDIAQGKTKTSDAQAAVARFFEVNLNLRRFEEGSTKITNFKFDPVAVKVSARAEIDLPLVFPFFGSDKSTKIATSSTVAFQERKVEVSMVLDVTGSMNNSTKATGSTKINDLKTSTNVAIDTFLAGGQAKTRVAIVPYSSGVNSGSFVSAVRDPSGNLPVGTCAHERRGTHMFDDVSPNTATARVTQANQVCPTTPVQPLTTNKAALKAMVSTLKPIGRTAGHIGLQWGQYMLSPKWKSLMPASAEPTIYNTPNVDKIMILMTDGLFNEEFSDLAPGSLPNFAGISEESGRLALAYCNNLKSNNVKVYTIGFDLDGIFDKAQRTEAQKTLVDCASSKANFFKADSGADLTAAFKEIAKRVEAVALTN
jgi:Flp pilus assembly protein TadG